jgi:hypothetical protein
MGTCHTLKGNPAALQHCLPSLALKPFVDHPHEPLDFLGATISSLTPEIALEAEFGAL